MAMLTPQQFALIVDGAQFVTPDHGVTWEQSDADLDDLVLLSDELMANWLGVPDERPDEVG